ncbi:MAG: ABC transporter substrate-binding protein [Ilumatobacteraceae bacterium]
MTIGLNEAQGSGVAYDGLKAGLDATGVPYKGNFVDHNSFQDNITSYLQQPDDVFTWFSGYRMRFFADKGLAGDVSDVWAGLTGFSDAFKTASTGNDGKQYLVPTSYYPWAVHYRKSLFEEKGYKVPTNKDELVALAQQMQADGSCRSPTPTMESGRSRARSTSSTCASTATSSTSTSWPARRTGRARR